MKVYTPWKVDNTSYFVWVSRKWRILSRTRHVFIDEPNDNLILYLLFFRSLYNYSHYQYFCSKKLYEFCRKKLPDENNKLHGKNCWQCPFTMVCGFNKSLLISSTYSQILNPIVQVTSKISHFKIFYHSIESFISCVIDLKNICEYYIENMI